MTEEVTINNFIIKFSQFSFMQRFKIAFYVIFGCDIDFKPSSLPDVMVTHD